MTPFECTFVVSSPGGITLLCATYDPQRDNLENEPRRLFFRGKHEVETVLDTYRAKGYAISPGSEPHTYLILPPEAHFISDDFSQRILTWLTSAKV